MSHITQLIAESLANSRFGDLTVMHQAEKDRVLVSFDDMPYYIMPISDRERIRIEAALEIAYGDSEEQMPESEFTALHKRFTIEG